MRESNRILTVYEGDMKNVVIPAGTRMIRGEEIALALNSKRRTKDSGIEGLRLPFQETRALRPAPWMIV